jgi:hypothetical protein
MVSPHTMSPSGSVNSSGGVIGWCDPSQRVLTPKMGIHVFWCVLVFWYDTIFGVSTRFLVYTIFGSVNSFFGVHHFLVCTRFLV